jgi:hypothetical protein
VCSERFGQYLRIRGAWGRKVQSTGTTGGRFEAKANFSCFYSQKMNLENSLRASPPCGRLHRAGLRRGATVLGLFLFSCLTARVSHAQGRDIVCRDGDGEFAAEFPTGVIVWAGATRNDLLAARACNAELSWGDQNLVVASGVSVTDIDAFGVDIGLGVPVAALQVKKSKEDCCMEYNIYSLHAPPILLRRITGGSVFGAADTDLDGRIEIWTDDAAAVEGFENLRLRDLDFAPPVILRFSREGRLLDASAEFRPDFDEKIEAVRKKLNPQDLADFKTSDGELAPGSYPANRLSRLKSVKVKVLEIVWSYLYSGREEEAWMSLAEMWPAGDIDRIRAALLDTRAHGIHSQVDGVSTPVRPGREIHAKIFDGTTQVAQAPQGLAPKNLKPKPPITPPRAILIEREPPTTATEVEIAKSESTLVLVIDSAGKVRSVEQLGNPEAVDDGLLRSTKNWKFIPAFDNGEPVASRILLGVSLRR